MGKIENVKTYAGADLDTIFFRPMLTGPGAGELGIRVLYNTPVPTTLHFWRRSGDILQKYGQAGWNGGSASEKFQKTIRMHKVKAEMGYSAEDYFSLVYEQIAARADVNMDDLSGTELETAETELFRGLRLANLFTGFVCGVEFWSYLENAAEISEHPVFRWLRKYMKKQLDKAIDNE